MAKRLRTAIRERRGEGYFDSLITVMVVMMMIALMINVIPAFVAKQQLNLFAQEIVREAEISGRIGSEVDAKIAELREQTTMDPSISWDTTYYSGNKVQLNTSIRVTVTANVRLGGFGGLLTVSIPITGKASGRSEVYFK